MGSNPYDCASPGVQGDNFAIYGQEKSFFPSATQPGGIYDEPKNVL